MTTFERWDYLDDAHNIVDVGETDVTHEQVDAMNDYDLQEWVDAWYEVDEVPEAAPLTTAEDEVGAQSAELTELAMEAMKTRAESAEAALEELQDEIRDLRTLASIEAGKQRDAAIARAESAEAALAERDTPCVWRRGPGAWGIPLNCENRPMPVNGMFQFCLYCGHPIEFGPTLESAR